MDLRLYARVLWRFRFLVVLGIIAGSVLSVVSAASVTVADGVPRLAYRDGATWEARGTLLVTERGFPEGYKTIPEPDAVSGAAGEDAGDATFGDPSRFARLAVLYAHLGQTNGVQSRVGRDMLEAGKISVSARSSPSLGALPFVDVVATARSAGAAERLANAGIEALRDYVAAEQAANRVPAADRVVLAIVGHPESATLVAGRPKARPVVAFLAVMLVAVTLAFVLENVRPQARTIHGGAGLSPS